jgi:CrcB protein
VDLPVDPDLEPRPSPFGAAGRRTWPRLRALVIVAVFVGGCIGGLGRYLVDEAVPDSAHGFPWATLVVNTSGAFLLAVMLVVVIEMLPPTTYVRPLLGTGFCGALTTFSAVVASTDRLVAQGHVATGLLSLLANVLGGLAAAGLGLGTARSVAASRRRRQRRGEPAQDSGPD